MKTLTFDELGELHVRAMLAWRETTQVILRGFARQSIEDLQELHDTYEEMCREFDEAVWWLHDLAFPPEGS